jgi:hypothetical protein
MTEMVYGIKKTVKLLFPVQISVIGITERLEIRLFLKRV